MRSLNSSVILISVATILIVAGCAPKKNLPITSSTSKAGYHYQAVREKPSPDKPFVLLAFSGGGTRAAAFSFGLMEALAKVQYTPKVGTSKRKLLDNVEIISSVSGGSFTAAYYVLFPDSFFDDFPKKMLYQNIQAELVFNLFNPYNWFRLASPNFSRIDMAAEYYDQNIFQKKTFADLLENPKGKVPFLVLNATDIGITHRFEFTQDQFDLLCSDLATVSVARGVAASSNFPVAFAPLTVNIYKGNEEDNINCPPMPKWINLALEDSRFDRRYSEAEAAASYRRKDRSFAHLLDGGLSDNLGLRGAFHAVTTTDNNKNILNTKLDSLMVIVANAKTTKNHDWDMKSNPPGITSVLNVALNGPMDDVSFDSVEMFENHFKYMKQISDTVEACNKQLKDCRGEPLITNPIKTNYSFTELSFDRVRDKHLRRCLQELPTSFALPRKTIDLLRQVAAESLMTSKSFIDGMRHLDPAWNPESIVIDPKLVNEVCGVSTHE
ncbi:MAG: patatin-like phospholipase family protein [Desulfobulbus sp.]